MPNIRVNDIEMHYADAGTGPALVFLHGWGTGGSVWDQQARYFAHSYRVVQPDLRGCGRTSAPSTGNSIRQIASDVRGLIVQLGLERVTLVGASMGASFAVEVARSWPELLELVVTVDGPFHLGTRMSDGDIRPLLKGLSQDRIPTLTRMVDTWFTGPDRDAYGFWALKMVLESSPFIADLYVDHLGYDPRPYLSELEVPLSLIHGEMDPEVPVDIAHEVVRESPSAELRVIPGAGHFPHLTDAAEFNSTLKTIIEGLPQEVGT